ncbi:MAG: 6-hydroxymethylpterin diphosphokinase MptE-like protein, partial [Chloroflexota bacterium]|nr:6-hydroxymethylpterin diphosphokinase MptE-like protein [Chloroflexota bacterium]
SIQRLAALKDIHKGERCFIIGNGPSLKNTDVSKLKDEYTFGMNRIYLAFSDWGFQTSYLASVNSLVIEQCSQDFQQLEIPKFFSWRSRNLLYPAGGKPDAHAHFLHTTYDGPKFAQNAAHRLWEGATVTYVCLQLAFHMGFEKAILIGVDHSFATKGEANKTIVSQGDDPNHFSAKYFGKGFKWQLPDLDTSELAYLRARQSYENAGRQVIDATIGGKLAIFPKVEYDTLFE